MRRVPPRLSPAAIASRVWAFFVAIALVVPLTAAVVRASDVGLTGAEGHPRSRFPLGVYVAQISDPVLDGAARRAVGDWNAVSREALGFDVFKDVAQAADAQVVVTLESRGSGRLMGETHLDVERGGFINPPVRIAVFEPEARGQTTADVLLYQVVAHELGHALGLEHVRDPRSLMCCVSGSIDFNDPAQRDAYIAARRHPDVRSVRDQLVEHFDRFAKTHP